VSRSIGIGSASKRPRKDDKKNVLFRVWCRKSVPSARAGKARSCRLGKPSGCFVGFVCAEGPASKFVLLKPQNPLAAGGKGWEKMLLF